MFAEGCIKSRANWPSLVNKNKPTLLISKRRLQEGVELEDGFSYFDSIRSVATGDSSNRLFYVTLTRGRNREVRRLWESQGLQVSRLKRIRFGTILLPSTLKRGYWREINPNDYRMLR